jgi:hypothetical protein
MNFRQRARQAVELKLSSLEEIKDGPLDEIRCIFDEDKDRYVPAFWDTTIDTPSRDSADTARFEPFGEEEVNIGVEGLYGCTTLMIVSSRGPTLPIGGKTQVSEANES